MAEGAESKDEALPRPELRNCVEPLRQSADAAVCTLPRDHSLGDGTPDLALGDLEGIARALLISCVEGFATLLHHRTHLATNMLIALSPTLGLTNAFECGFMVGQAASPCWWAAHHTHGWVDRLGRVSRSG